MSFSVTSFVMYKIKKLKSFIREEKVFRKKKTKSFLKPVCYGYGSGNVTEFLSFVDPWSFTFKIKSFILPGMRFANPGKKEKEKCSHINWAKIHGDALKKQSKRWQTRNQKNL